MTEEDRFLRKLTTKSAQTSMRNLLRCLRLTNTEQTEIMKRIDRLGIATLHDLSRYLEYPYTIYHYIARGEFFQTPLVDLLLYHRKNPSTKAFLDVIEYFLAKLESDPSAILFIPTTAYGTIVCPHDRDAESYASLSITIRKTQPSISILDAESFFEYEPLDLTKLFV